MDCPAKGPGRVPFALNTRSTAGSPTASGWLTPVMCVAKYCANRVSRKRRSPIESSAGVVSASEGKDGALPALQLIITSMAVIPDIHKTVDLLTTFICGFLAGWRNRWRPVLPDS